MIHKSQGLPNSTMSKTKVVPFKATQFWNETAEAFFKQMPRKRHMRQLKFHHNCFAAKNAVDHMHEILKNNHSLKNEVTRQQAVLLLGKFLQANIIEPVQGVWKHEDLQDNNQLYRFVCERDEMQSDSNCTIASACNDSLNRTLPNLPSCRTRNSECQEAKPEDKQNSASRLRRGRPIRPRRHTETPANVETRCVCKDAFVSQLKRTLQVKSLDHIAQIKNLNDQWIKVNIANVNNLGVDSMEQDVPRWVARAMTCLVSWEADLCKDPPHYEKIEKHLFGMVAGYFTAQDSSSEKKRRPPPKACEDFFEPSSEPLLSPEVCQLIANLAALKECNTQSKALEVLQLCFLLLAPTRRRKLRLLLRFMTKVSENPHLKKLHDSLCTSDLLLHTFSKVIYDYGEDQEYNGFHPERFVFYLMKYHEEIMKVPEKFLTDLKEAENNIVGVVESRAISVRPRSPSSEALKAIISGAKHKLPSQKLSEKLMKRKKHCRLFVDNALLCTPGKRQLATVESSLGVLASETINICCDLNESSKERKSTRKISTSESQNSLRSLLCRLWKNNE